MPWTHILHMKSDVSDTIRHDMLRIFQVSGYHRWNVEAESSILFSSSTDMFTNCSCSMDHPLYIFLSYICYILINNRSLLYLKNSMYLGYGLLNFYV